MIKQEWKNIFHNTWIKIVLVALIAIPSIYTVVFLGSMWDPYGNSGDLPVAVVNEDKAVVYNDKNLNVGKELVNKLKDNDSLDFHFVSQKKAMSGLKDGDYYMVITIPSNFSKNATTLLDKEPQKMILKYTTNPGTNYVASKMDDSAIAKIKAEVSSSVTKTYAETIFTSIGTMSDGFAEASDGTQQLSDGMSQLKDGNKTISDNLKVLASSSLTFKDGTNTLTKGLKDYTDGVSQLASGAKTLSNGLNQYTAGVSQALAGTTQLVGNNDTLNNGVSALGAGLASAQAGNSKIAAGLQEMGNQVSESNTQLQSYITLITVLKNSGNETLANTILTSGLSFETAKRLGLDKMGVTSDLPSSYQLVQTVSAGLNSMNTALNVGSTDSEGNKVQSLVAGSSAIQAGLNEMNAKVNGGEFQTVVDGNKVTVKVETDKALVNGIQAYTAGVSQVNAGLNQLAANNATLTGGLDKLAAGTSTLVSNNGTLMSGANQLADGAGQISDGAGKLAAGSDTLGEGITTAADGVTTLNDALKSGAEESKIDSTNKTTDMVAAPVDTKHKEISKVENNGHAMAPYMMSVGLYVTCLAFALMYPLRHGIKKAEDALKYWASKATVMYTVSTLAAIIMVTALRLINGFEPVNLGMTYLLAILVSAAFMSLVILLSLTTGYIGDFLLLVFMIVNLGGSAGTYPLETGPMIYKVIHKFVPYTYSVDGFRKVISMTNPSLSAEIAVFVGIIVVCSVLTVVYFKFKNKEDKHVFPQVFEEVNGTKSHE